MAQKILVVDDDPITRNLLKLYLDQERYTVLLAENGREALDFARQRKPDLILLDLMLPKVDGLDVCRILRAESAVPIIMLTARISEDEMLLGLDLGADDYIKKPFSPKEVLARVRTVLRRMLATDGQNPEELCIDKLKLNFRRREVRIDGKKLDLTAKEYKLLEVLATDLGRIFSRAELLDAAFPLEDDVLERAVDFHIMNLRKKIEEESAGQRYIQTVHGLGFRLVEDDDLD